jgi:hypothetical protein
MNPIKLWSLSILTEMVKMRFDIISFTEDPKIAYASGYNEQGRRSIFKINLQTDEILESVFSHKEVDFDDIINHPNSGNPVGFQYTIDKPTIVFFDKKLKKIQKIVNSALPDTVNNVVSIQLEKKNIYYLQQAISRQMYSINWIWKLKIYHSGTSARWSSFSR